MMNQVSKAQKEVWDMKDAVYHKIKHLPKRKRIEFILKETEETIKQIELIKLMKKN